jgi:ABC-type protease/lipase transport system fused ATPase/permease subunit
MATASPQTYSNHVRRDPLFHFFLLPVLAISLGVSVYVCVHHPRFLTFWAIVFVAAVNVIALKARLYALKVQDRVIRLEERLRLAVLLPESQRSLIAKLSEGQLIALRFASDEEVPALVERAISANLSRADIKKSIKNWRPDYWRV